MFASNELELEKIVVESPFYRLTKRLLSSNPFCYDKSLQE